MANFGLTSLAVVDPYEPHWREASSAVGSEDLLENARIAASLAEAVAGATLVVGTGTLTRRAAEQPVVSLPELAPRAAAEIARGGRVALVFGPEKHGLTRRDLSLCHMLVEIPTHPRQPSMNLGQAVAVCLYELARRGELAGHGPHPSDKNQGVARVGHPAAPLPQAESGDADPPASSAELDRLAQVVEEAMQAARYSPAGMRAANQHDLRLLLRRLALTSRDARRILGLFRRMSWQMGAVRRGKTP